MNDTRNMRSRLPLICNFPTSQAPLLAYNSFVEALFSLNCCREGLAAGALASQSLEDAGPVGISAEVAAPVTGSSPPARAKRDVIYEWVSRQVPAALMSS